MDKQIDLLVEGGRVVAGGAVAEATLAISEGKFAALLAPGLLPPGASSARRLDVSGKVILPGILDVHVHFGNFNDAADSFTSMSTAAAFGGVTTVIPYIQGGPGMTIREFLTHFRDEGEAQSLVDFALHLRVPPPQPGIIRQFDDALELGVTSFKLFMAYRKRGIMWNDHQLYEALEYVGRRGGIFCCHAENGDIIDYLEDKYLAEGCYTPENYLATRPPEAEAEATFRALTLARLAACPLYLVHMSTGRGIDLARQARLEGQPVLIESCPQYLTLTNKEMKRQGGRTKIAPPLRRAEELHAVWQAAADGTLDTIGSDHAPWPQANKSLPPERFAEVSFGAPSLETMLPVVYSEGVVAGRISLPRLAELLCEGPARAFDLFPRKGTIAVGSDADLSVIDPKAKWQVQGTEMHSQAGYTPYEGWTLKGKPVMTVVRGEVVMQEGRLLQSPGYGEYLPRAPRS